MFSLTVIIMEHMRLRGDSSRRDPSSAYCGEANGQTSKKAARNNTLQEAGRASSPSGVKQSGDQVAPRRALGHNPHYQFGRVHANPPCSSLDTRSIILGMFSVGWRTSWCGIANSLPSPSVQYFHTFSSQKCVCTATSAFSEAEATGLSEWRMHASSCTQQLQGEKADMAIGVPVNSVRST